MSLDVALIAVSAAVALLAAFVFRRRLPSPAVAAVLALAGIGLGVGGMLIQPAPSTAECVAAVTLLAILIPAHVRIVLGPFGPRG